MDKSNGWLNRDFTDWMSKLAKVESPLACGIFVVRCEAEGQGQRDMTEPADVCLRIERLLRASAMRFAKLTNAVLGWTQTGATLIVAVSLSPEEPEEPGQEEIEAGRLTYALRDSLFARFTSKHADRGRLDLSQRVNRLRHGFGWIAKPGEEALAGFDQACAKVLRAVESAIGRMFGPDNQELRFVVADGERAPSHRSATSIEARYAPIVSLLDGSLYGYEAVPYDQSSGARIDLNEFYRDANDAGLLFESDRAFREAAIRGFPSRNGDVKLFLPVPASVVFDTRLYAGSTLRRIESAGLRPEHVVLVLFGGDEEQGAALKAALGHYRMQGFRIALSGITASRSDLHRMISLQPDYSLISLSGIGDGSPGPVEESLLQAMTTLARKEQIVLIADGVNREETLPLLVASGLSYGLGAWIGEEQLRTGQAAVSPHIQSRIRAEVQRRYRGATGSLSQLAIPVIQFPRETLVSEISRYFELHRETQAIVIIENETPVGLIMKERLHQLLSGQFGLPLYWNRPVGKIMDAHPMRADESVSIDQVSQMAMAREPDKLYDAVIVTRGGKLSGIVFVQAMLEWVTRTRVEFAQWANPLTGLPGNVPIQRELIRRLAEGKAFAIWYADLDHFKWYNDQYGFHNGDEVIRYTAEVLSEGVRDYDPKESGECFVGHVGGDDFIVMTVYADPVAAARQTLKRFESGIGTFVGGKKTGVVYDRNGQPVEGAGLSLSLSLLLFESSEGWTPETVSGRSAHLKKKSKQTKGNSLVWEVADSAYAEWSVT
ncbi:GGDEF domain-containing protein [Cohnella sp. GCM10027633]|uniref:GGDEF domain-containing protein n=1 Tax=unclassified Cohnella TaxID=2636738 RepID=UPI00362CF0DE